MGETNQPITAPKKNGGGSANTNIVQLIKSGGYIQFSVPKSATSFSCKTLGVIKITKTKI
jgi:hypothetical protein